MAFYEAASAWHDGEKQMRKMLHVPQDDNPTQPFLSPFAHSLLTLAPLLAVGTIDTQGRPWTTLWGGESGFSRAIAQSVIGVRATVDRSYDPVVEVLSGGKADGEVVQEQGNGKMVSGLAIDLESRRRVKLYGRRVASALTATEDGIGEVQLVVKIEQSLGNCPKYLNKKHIVPHIPGPRLISSDLPLPQEALNLITKSDLFFISSSNHDSDMDTNHRGGPPGFVRILSSGEDGLTLVYPEYSGNRLYQTLGNLSTTPQAGLVFANFDNGDVLYVTGRTEIVAGQKAKDLIAHSNLAVKIKVEAARFVKDGLAFRGIEGEYSPYNPPVRYLSTETKTDLAVDDNQILAKLIGKQVLTPTIARFRFQLRGPAKAGTWKPGQYVAMSFADELDIGYSHMRDDDPKSLNDDFLRTFTVSSRQGALDDHDQFEITIRKVGPVTDLLFKTNVRAQLEVPLQGFGGEFFLEQSADESIAFVAGGVGATPLIAQAADLDLRRLIFIWTVKEDDLGFVIDTFDRIPGLAKSTRLFVSGITNEEVEDWKKLEISEVTLYKRRMAKDDLLKETASRWYLCTGPRLRNSLLSWLEGKTLNHRRVSNIENVENLQLHHIISISSPWRQFIHDSEPQSSLVSSLSVTRAVDNERFLATEIPKTLTKDRGQDRITTPLAPCILPSTAVTLSLILNHPHIISLVDIQPITSLSGSVSESGPNADLTIWEDMNAGTLAYLLPDVSDLPSVNDAVGWHALCSVDLSRPSLPESLCWHVLRSISKALLWLHYGVKETEGIRGEYLKHDDDWHAILIRDISPSQIWFKKARGRSDNFGPETYGECKLGGFHWAKVTGTVESRVAVASRVEDASREKTLFWAPEIYKNTSPWCRASEIWSLGAVIYMMMTGIPPPRVYNYAWQISRMTDKAFSPWLRDIVATMLDPRIANRPDALDLVGRTENGWEAWRANTKEGAQYVDVGDRELEERFARSSRGTGALTSIMDL
ncbi:Serine threonine-kinase ATG1 [Hyphodiscus hymeniophilus]|uniref:Serine threonine-kinase ATG1 n=1 Tax=Hyphodiscus hymeniophilus TaxID=353542 RepID=A0A9P6SLB5_9HELO|nr:Serine threonine-kinase ATG1 [Hyphodiscus hymeniophilus]